MHQLLFSIKRVHWLWHRRSLELLAERFARVSPAQFTMLRTLFTYKFGIVRHKLARLLGVAASGVSRMVKKLEAEGFVERRRYEDDRRFVCVKLTEDGREFVEETLGYGDGLDPLGMLVDSVDREVKEWFGSTERLEEELALLDQFLVRARVRRRDRAIYPVPWHGGEVLTGEPGTIVEPPPTKLAA